MKQGSPQVFVAVNLSARGNEHVLCETNPAQAAMGALHPLDAALFAVRNNDHQIHIAVVIGRAPGVRTEQINFLRLKFNFQSLDGFFQQTLRNYLHDIEATILAADLKARVCGRRDARAALKRIHAQFVPGRIVLLADDGAGQTFLGKHLEFIQRLKMRAGKATAFVCQDYVCELPTTEIPVMRRLISGQVQSPGAAGNVETDNAAANPPVGPHTKEKR